MYLSALSDEAAELSGAASQFESRVLATAVNRVEDWIEGAKERGVASRSMITKVAGDVEYLLRCLDEDESVLLQSSDTSGQPSEAKDSASNAAVEAANAEVEVKAREAGVLRTRCEALQRKCELLGALEKDGRLENGALHKVSPFRSVMTATNEYSTDVAFCLATTTGIQRGARPHVRRRTADVFERRSESPARGGQEDEITAQRPAAQDVGAGEGPQGAEVSV